MEQQFTEAAAAGECEAATALGWPDRISWPRLLEWVFDIDTQHCPDL